MEAVDHNPPAVTGTCAEVFASTNRLLGSISCISVRLNAVAFFTNAESTVTFDAEETAAFSSNSGVIEIDDDEDDVAGEVAAPNNTVVFSSGLTVATAVAAEVEVVAVAAAVA